MRYELQKRVARELDARIPRGYGRSEQSRRQNVFRSEVNALWLHHGEPREEDIGTAAAHMQALFPGFLPNVVPRSKA
jgi:hypothetical protein